MSGHYKLNPPPHKPGLIKFYGAPDNNGAVLTDERVKAFAVIEAFGAQGSDQQSYVNLFFNGAKAADGNWTTPPQGHVAQLGDIGKYFQLSLAAQAAINKACANTRVEYLAGSSAFGLDAYGHPLEGVVAYLYNALNVPTGVSVEVTGSEYNKICADFQYNLNVGAHA